ncbi:MAG: sulfur carrier protein ThiS [Thiovulaceae bacterium]|nr:sulfur carrier protein ThiS [Sulfurimonadaceae bacterium]
MKVVVNGITREFQDNANLQNLIYELGLDDKVMAAAVNMEIVKQEEWSICKLHEDDKVELLDFVGGG